MRYFYTLLLLAVPATSLPAVAQSLVVETPPLTPAEQAEKFHLQPGFEIQLVASEPDINKPMNMEFDARGRLWVTHSKEYPFPGASDEAARDAITIFSNFNAAGKATKAERFAEKLNIPIGILPLNGTEALAWSIPNIYRLIDSDSDGVADTKRIAFGPFGVIDTHGNQNAFTRWIDGWVYANHGFSNESHVKIGGAGPAVLHMQSGNTYRFRPDGSRIEQYSWGQVNPFGLSFDSLGNLFSADCHSSAVSMLLRDGYYESFGKPHDGLGFAPAITTVDHGGTGIAGVAYSTLPDFPAKYRDVLFIGNVITNRVHCDRLTWHGSTPVVTKVEDFIACDDPWFRPVDLQLGPDGALYIADFYNCIIGHYEVPLDHPKRDRERGRIWRVVYKGTQERQSPSDQSLAMRDLHELGPQQLFELLTHPNLTVRVLATNVLVDNFPNEIVKLSSDLLLRLSRNSGVSRETRSPELDWACHAVWIVHRTGGIQESVARGLLAADGLAKVHTHLVKALGDTDRWSAWHYEVARDALSNADPFVRRGAAEALAKHPAIENLVPLLAALDAADQQDAQLYHQIRIAIRNQIRDASVADRLLTIEFNPEQKKQLIEFAATAPTGPAAMLLIDEALQGRLSDELLVKSLPEAARHIDPARVDALVTLVEDRFHGNVAQQLALCQSLAAGLYERAMPISNKLQSTLIRLMQAALSDASAVEWHNAPIPSSQPIGHADPARIWASEMRSCRDGQSAMMLSSLPAGEHYGATLRSPRFEVPPKLRFWMCGHNGLPDRPDRMLCYVRLVLDDGTEVERSYPPRDDIAHEYQWDLASYAGRQGYLEIVDGITDLDGFAWLAVSRFDPVVVFLQDATLGDSGSARSRLLRAAGQFKLRAMANQIAAIANRRDEDVKFRLDACGALVDLDPPSAVAPLRALVLDVSMPISVRETAAELLGRCGLADAREALIAAFRSAPGSVAVVIAANLARHRDSALTLFEEISAGRASAALLLEPTVAEALKASGLEGVEATIEELTADLSPADNRIVQLIASRREAFLAGKFDPEAGQAVFAKSVCASCHRIGEVGKTIGPALDGIGNRGLDRLLEDTLDPSRNVDAAFRSISIETVDGRVLTGFGLREEGATLVFHDANGEEVRLPLVDVVDRYPSALSPMPANVIEQMPESDYFALIAYLLSLRQE